MVHERLLESLGAASDSVAPNDTVAIRVAQRATYKTIRIDSARPVFEPEAAQSLRLPDCRAAAAGATVSPSQQVAHVFQSRKPLMLCQQTRCLSVRSDPTVTAIVCNAASPLLRAALAVASFNNVKRHFPTRFNPVPLLESVCLLSLNMYNVAA